MTPDCLGIKFKRFSLEFKTRRTGPRLLPDPRSLGIPDADPAAEAWLCGPDDCLCILTKLRFPSRPPSFSL